MWRLGWVSLLTDAGSDAIYPLLPFFLTRVLGGGAMALGITEGVAEATSSLLRLVSGRLADRWGARRGLVVGGYALSSIARPFIGLANQWTQVLGIRFLDRVGKGIRSAPRDALLAEWADPGERGRVFGFHRAMDNAGAVLGPLGATLFLWWMPGEYRTLFLLTAVPGFLTMLLVARVRDASHPALRDAVGPAEAGGTRTEPLSRPFYRYLGVVALFALGNSSDAFLLLRLTDALGGPQWVPGIWAALNLVRTGLSMAGGGLSDRLGRKPVIVAAWIVYAIVYAGFALTASVAGLVGWLIVYGVYFALAEGAEKALVADLAPSSARGTAFGLFHSVVGFTSLAASVLFGVIWNAYGAPVAFASGSALSVAAAVLLWVLVPSPGRPTGLSGGAAEEA